MVTLVNRAKMSTSTTGTGTITLGSAETGYQTFADAGVADGDVVRYVIEDGNDWEIGSGTYTATGTTLSRTVDESSNAGAALNLTGSAVVFITAAAEDIPALYVDNWDGTTTQPTASGTNGVAIGTNAIASGTRSFAAGHSAASGIDSFAASITNNTGIYGATNTNSVALGFRAKANANQGTAIGWDSRVTGSAGVAIGRNNAVYGSSGAALGGVQNTVDSPGTWSTVVGGYGNQASATSSLSCGRETLADADYSFSSGYQSSVKGLFGRTVHASGQFSAKGDAQTGTFVLRSDTTDATPEALTTNNSAASTDNQVILPNNSAYSFSGTIIARESATDGSDYASWEIKGALLRDANAASTVLGNGIVNKLYASAGASAWAVALTADTTNGGLKVEVTGAAATNIRWVATVNTSEVTYA